MSNQPLNDRVYHHRPTKSIDTWKIKFDGTAGELAVDEFLFRVETTARSTYTPFESLATGIHFLLGGRAAAWYWIQVRKYQNQTWEQIRTALIRRFSSEESDDEIRMAIESRRQLSRESFGDFSLVVQQMIVRLRRPISEADTVAIMRRNMSPRLREALLLHDTRTVDQLHAVCQRFEKLWYNYPTIRSDQPRKVCEMNIDNEQPPENCPHGYPNHQIEEIRPPTNNYVTCWNCKDLGHVFQDCLSPLKNVFCYGCGEPQTYKPNCAKCTAAGKGQGKPGAVGPRQPEIFQRQPNCQAQARRPNPFQK